MKVKIKILAMIIFTIVVSSLNAQALFEIKDASDNTVFSIADDGLRVFNLGDTLMVISASEIKANISDGKGRALSRSFSVTTSTTGKAGLANMLEVTTDATSMREGVLGMKYTDFSPENIFLGLNAGDSTTIGSSNTFIGNYAGANNTTGNSNVMIGESAGRYYNGSFGNVFVGQEAAKNLIQGQRNVMIGYNAGADPESSQNSLGNVFIGGVAGRKINGDDNVIIGEAAGENYQTGGSNGYNNVFIGKETGQHSTGHDNIYIGVRAGQGESTAVNPGSNNIYMGTGVGWSETDSDRLRIGSLIYGHLTLPRMLVVNGEDTDNPNSRTFYVNGDAGGTTAWYNDSDKKLKKNISTIDDALNKVNSLRGVTFNWRDDKKYEKGPHIGFIAQEAIEVIPEVVDHNEEKDHYSMQYAPITALLVEAVKELKKKNENLNQENESLNKRLNEIEEILEKLDK